MNSASAGVKPIFAGFFAAVAGLLIGSRYFPTSEAMAASAFVAIGLGQLMHELLDYNRRVIWSGEVSGTEANRKLALELGGIFCGVLLAATLFYSYGQPIGAINPRLVYRNELVPLISHNFLVLLVCTLITFVYRASGLVLVLSWNALGWAEALSNYIRMTGNGSSLGTGIVVVLILLPHLLLEAFAYVLAGMGGLFLSKAVTKYAIRSAEFRQVFKASAALVAASLVILGLAGAVEYYFAQPLFQRSLNTSSII